MTVFIDNVNIRKHGKVWCHMISDAPSGDDEELLRMATMIGLKQKWIQHAGTASAHFDIVESKKTMALEHGAYACTTKDIGRIIKNKLKREEA